MCAFVNVHLRRLDSIYVHIWKHVYTETEFHKCAFMNDIFHICTFIEVIFLICALS